MMEAYAYSAVIVAIAVIAFIFINAANFVVNGSALWWPGSPIQGWDIAAAVALSPILAFIAAMTWPLFALFGLLCLAIYAPTYFRKRKGILEANR